MICEYCGNQAPDNSTVCPFCNAKFGTGEAAPAAPADQTAQATPAAQAAPAGQGAAASQQSPGGQKPPSASPAFATALNPAAASKSAPYGQVPGQPAATGVPGAQPAPKQKSRLPLVLAIAAVIVVVVVGVFAIGGTGKGSDQPVTQTVQVTAPDDVKAALEDASGLAQELADRYNAYLAASEDSGSQDSAYNMTYDEGRALLNKGLARIDDDLKTLEASGTSWKGYDQAKASMENIREILNYEMQILDAQQNASPNGATGPQAMINAIEALYEGYSAIDAPPFIKDYIQNSLDKMPVIEAGVIYNAQGASSTLSQYTYQELLQWWTAKQVGYDQQQDKAVVSQMEASRDMLNDIASGTMKAGDPHVEIDSVNKIAPNLYPSLDAATNLAIVSYDGDKSVMVTAEIAGFSQKFEQKYELNQGYNYFVIKPSVLPSNEMTNLSSNSSTQLNVKVTDAETGKVLAQESKDIDLLSMYDFTWNDDEFGHTFIFDILAWLRPQADEVNEVNRLAASYVSKWTNGQISSLAGYQFGDDWSATLLQVAAIQAAISEKGVAYVMDSYSFTSDQHVLTPDQVVQKQQGLCIETTLLMASCLMSAGMHPQIIITPGHAQIAVETYSGSGNYFLIETTTLPYGGINTKYTYTDAAFWNGLLASMQTTSGTSRVVTLSGSSDEWKAYFDAVASAKMENGGIYVIDCNLQKVLDIQGLENM